jgi:hypothetical protein
MRRDLASEGAEKPLFRASKFSLARYNPAFFSNRQESKHARKTDREQESKTHCCQQEDGCNPQVSACEQENHR